MLNAIKHFVRAVDRRVGWSRIGIAASVMIMALAFFVLFRLLRDIDFAKVVEAMGEIPLSAIGISALFAAAGYFTLTFYDFFALRTIGRPEIPYPVAALTSFSSYSIGHNIGATVLVSAALRLRIYAPWRVSLMEIAKIAFITGLTYWLGNIVVLSGALAYAPEAVGPITRLPAVVNRMIGLGGLAVVVGYLIWLAGRERAVGRGGIRIVLPNAPLTLVQIGIGVLDLAFGAVALYVLLPATPGIDFMTVLTVFVSAALMGFITHAPGGLGVFDAAVLIALSQYDREQLLASLLIFRLIYFIAPFAVALLALGIREMRSNLVKDEPLKTSPNVPLVDDEPARVTVKELERSGAGRD